MTNEEGVKRLLQMYKDNRTTNPYPMELARFFAKRETLEDMIIDDFDYFISMIALIVNVAADLPSNEMLQKIISEVMSKKIINEIDANTTKM